MGNGSAPPESARGPNATPVFPDAARILGESGYPKIRPDAAFATLAKTLVFRENPSQSKHLA